MKDDLISRESVLDYIEKEIATAKCTETISYLRALSVHINEYEPTAFDVDKVVEKIESLNEKAQLRRKELIELDSYNDVVIKCIEYERGRVYSFDDALQIIKEGGIDES